MRRLSFPAIIAVALCACSREAPSRDAPGEPAAPPARDVRTIPTHGRELLDENSAAVMSDSQPGVFFTINDSGNDPILFALDTTGADRGAWRVRGAKDVDWESASLGPCDATTRERHCIYIGDTGDNGAVHSTETIYKVREPAARDGRFMGRIDAQRLEYRYPDEPHDVEAMYVAPDRTVYLITKRVLATDTGHLRPALVFALPPTYWDSIGVVVAQRVDSLPIVPGSADLRLITDASLSRDAKHVAVRTYAEVYVFDADSITGRIDTRTPPSRCDIFGVGEALAEGEGVTWMPASTRLLLTTEGVAAAMHIVSCPMPAR